ncbi:MAG: ATP-binding protein [Terriglobia bacterium]
MLKSKPDGSYAFFGAPGVGKTHLLAALFRHAIETDVESHASTIYVSLSEVLRAFNLVAIGEKPEGNGWRAIQAPWQPARCRIFLDEFDKAATLSTFTFARVNEFIDKLYGRGDCQLCIASNMRREELLNIWGAAVVRRLDDLCMPFDFFETEKVGRIV